jgi:hypothetical protein
VWSERSCDVHQHWEVQGLNGQGGGLEWRASVPCDYIHQSGRYERRADGKRVRGLPAYACSRRGHCGRVVEYGNSFQGHQGSWLYLIESPEGDFFLTQAEVDDIASYLRTELEYVAEDNSFAQDDPNFFTFDAGAEQERQESLLAAPRRQSLEVRVDRGGRATRHSAAPPRSPTLSPIDVDDRPQSSRARPTSSRRLAFAPPTRPARVDFADGAHVAAVSNKRKHSGPNTLLDWLRSAEPLYNPYLGSLNNVRDIHQLWDVEHAETETPERRRNRTSSNDNVPPRKRKKVKREPKQEEEKPEKRARAGRSNIKGKKTRGRTKWAGAYNAMLSLPLKSGLSRDEVYEAAGLNFNVKSQRRVMERFMLKHRWVFATGLLRRRRIK